MDIFRPEIMVFLFLIVAAIALFSYLSVSKYIDGRRKEREAYYRSETMRRMAETQGAGAAAAIELLREEEAITARKRLEGLKLGGLITSSIGIGLMIFLFFADDSRPHVAFLCGLIPLLVGVALLAYVYSLAGRSPKYA